MTEPADLPALPEPADSMSWGGPRENIFTAVQMQSYAREAIAAHVARIAELEAWQAAAFDAHPNLDLDIEAAQRAQQFPGIDIDRVHFRSKPTP